MSMAWEPDRRSNFFFSPPAHLCAVTYMTEITLIVTLNNQFTFTLSQKVHELQQVRSQQLELQIHCLKFIQIVTDSFID